MPNLVRVSLSLEEPLFEKLEELVKASGYENRSEFVRDMIRDRLVSEEWREGDESVLGTITLVYDHHKRELSEKLTDIQHKHHHNVLAATHVHLSHDLCAEMIMVRGEPSEIVELADQLRKQRGVLHATLSTTSTGSKLH